MEFQLLLSMDFFIFTHLFPLPCTYNPLNWLVAGKNFVATRSFLSVEPGIWGYLYLTFLFLLIFALAVLFAERKFIAAAQKRLGITFLGRNGWIHLPADLVKFWLKQIQSPSPFVFATFGGAISLILAYLVWLSVSGFFLISDGLLTPLNLGDYDIFFFLAYALLTTLFFFYVVSGTQSKYATIAASRLLVVALSLDVFFAMSFLFFCGHAGGCSIEDLADVNSLLTPSCAIPPLALVLFLHTLYEAKRAPFDHAEAESELVAGHLVEFGGRALLFLYLCEYLHVFFSIFSLSIFVLGGAWGLPLFPASLYWEIFFIFN